MSALDDLKEIDLEKITALEAAVVFLSHKHEGDAALATQQLADKDAELLALRERVAKLEKKLAKSEKLIAEYKAAILSQ